MLEIAFERGTLAINAGEHSYLVQDTPHCQWDVRTHCFRVPAYQYYNLVSALYRAKIPYQDRARAYDEVEIHWGLERIPFPYQKEAIASWAKSNRRGYVVLPTGTGKSYVGAMAMVHAARSTLVLVPTIDLMHQWYDTIKTYFEKAEVGLIGGGYFEVAPFTVMTYSSAYRHLEELGNRFGLIIFDECHHLPGMSYQLAAQFAIAPYRLGLTATPDRSDGGHNVLNDLIGPCVYRKSITEMSGEYLAAYEVIQISAKLSHQERGDYKAYRATYLSFLREKNLRLSGGNWQRFIQLTSRSPKGRQAFRAYWKQKEIAQANPSKLKILERLLIKHYKERILIFTHDNNTAYKIARQFLVPIITHQTKTKERRDYLLGFNQGTYSILVTSKVLNEGVNIPAANIGIVLSGSGSVREHVQRLGRILRKYGDKKATLYEIVAEDTAEEYTSQRRRDHEAYHRRPDSERGNFWG